MGQMCGQTCCWCCWRAAQTAAAPPRSHQRFETHSRGPALALARAAACLFDFGAAILGGGALSPGRTHGCCWWRRSLLLVKLLHSWRGAAAERSGPRPRTPCKHAPQLASPWGPWLLSSLHPTASVGYSCQHMCQDVGTGRCFQRPWQVSRTPCVVPSAVVCSAALLQQCTWTCVGQPGCMVLARGGWVCS